MTTKKKTAADLRAEHQRIADELAEIDAAAAAAEMEAVRVADLARADRARAVLKGFAEMEAAEKAAGNAASKAAKDAGIAGDFPAFIAAKKEWLACRDARASLWGMQDSARSFLAGRGEDMSDYPDVGSREVRYIPFDSRVLNEFLSLSSNSISTRGSELAAEIASTVLDVADVDPDEEI